MKMRQTMAAEIEAAWRYYLFNWVVVGVIGAALALSFFAGNFALEPTALALAVGYIGLFEGLADGRTRTPARHEPRATFMLGGTAQIVLFTALLSPLLHGAAAAGVAAHDTNLSGLGRAVCAAFAAMPCANFRAMLGGALHDAAALIHWSVFAIPVLLAANRQLRRVEEFTLAFALALIATAIVSAVLPVHSRSASESFFPLASAALCVWAAWPLPWLRPLAMLAFGIVLAAAPWRGDALLECAGGVGIALLAIVMARAIGRIVARQAHHTSGPFAAALPAD